VDRFVTNLV